MFNIASYLEKFKNFGQSEKLFKEAVLSSIKEVTGLILDKEIISIKNGEIIIKASPGIKSVLFINKEKILVKIKEKVNNPIIDLR